MRLDDKYYDAIVINDELDVNKSGAVKVKIFGLTDDLPDEAQPFALPSYDTHQAVPVKGTRVRISFDEGDINMPKYTHMSVDQSVLNEEFVQNYPNVAVINLGEASFKLIHNRNTQTSIIEHPSSSRLEWSGKGVITHDSDLAYSNAGRGALDGTGERLQNVLTEGTIDIFCCTPVGNNRATGGLSQGSEYLRISHVSKVSVDAITNGIIDFNSTTDETPIIDNGVNNGEQRDLYDTNGNPIQKIEYVESLSAIDNSSKVIRGIVIDLADVDDFTEISSNVLDKNSPYSAHYVIGVNDSEIIQLADLKSDCYLGNNYPLIGIKYNINTVSILLVGDGSEFTDYQYNMITNIINTVRHEFKNQFIKYTLLTDTFNPNKWDKFNKDKVISNSYVNVLL